MTRVAATLLPQSPPAFLARTPHGHGHPERIRAELTEAGFSKIDIDLESRISTAPDPSVPAIAYARGTPMYGEISPHGEKMVARIIDAATEEIRARFGEGEVSAKIQGFVVTAA